MFRREDAAYLRRKAAQFRHLAPSVEDPVSTQLRELADELDILAEEIEGRAVASRPVPDMPSL